MASMNKITLIGNLGADAETRYTTGGEMVAGFNLAVNMPHTAADGVKTETVQWFRCSAWRKLGEIVAQYAKKGMQVYVEGPLQVREFTGNDGAKRFSLDVTVREFQMMGNRVIVGAEGTGAPVANDTPIPDAAPRRAEQLVGVGATEQSEGEQEGDTTA